MKSNFLLINFLAIMLLSCEDEHFPNTKFLNSKYKVIEANEVTISLNPDYQISIISEFEMEGDNPEYLLSINTGPIMVINDSSFLLPYSVGYSGPHDLYNKSDVLNLTKDSGYFNISDILTLTVKHSGQEFTKTIIIE